MVILESLDETMKKVLIENELVEDLGQDLEFGVEEKCIEFSLEDQL